MDLYEELVQLHLTVFENCFVQPQFHVSTQDNGNPWEAWLDFVALDFRNKQINVVEVSKTTTGSKATELAAKLTEAYRRRVGRYIGDTVNRDLNFAIHWRFFVRRDNVQRLLGQAAYREYINSGGNASVTAIEDIFDAVRDRMP